MYFIGKPIHFELTENQYNDVQRGNFTWSNVGSNSITTAAEFGNAGFIVLNKGQTTINQLFEGYYIGAIDNANLNPATNFDGILNVQSVSQSAVSTSNYTAIPTTRLNFSLSSLSDNQPSNVVTFGDVGTSVSQVMEDASPFTIATSQYDDTLTVGLFKLRQSVFSPDSIKLDYVFSEKYIGSLDYWREINSQNGGQPVSYFLETREDTSPNIQLLVNPYISNKNGKSWLDTNGFPTKKVRTVTQNFASASKILSNFVATSAAYGVTSYTQITQLTGSMIAAYNALGAADSMFAVGSYADGNLQNKDIGSIPTKLDRMFSVAENSELYNIDLTLDGGLTTIHAVQQYQGGSYFNDAVNIDLSGLAVTNPENVSGIAVTFKDNYVTDKGALNKLISYFKHLSIRQLIASAEVYYDLGLNDTMGKLIKSDNVASPFYVNNMKSDISSLPFDQTILSSDHKKKRYIDVKKASDNYNLFTLVGDNGDIGHTSKQRLNICL
jgi:hypothetical protein